MSFIAAAIIGATATAAATAYSSRQARKAQKRAREDQRFRELIEGAAPNISNVQEVAPEEVIGSEVAGLEAALKAMDYQGGQPPVPGQDDAMAAMPTDLSEEDLAMLIQSGGLEGLFTQMAAEGGPVGTPNDVYYFGVPQIMGMMQDPDPQIQQVGMQLAGQMEAMPEAGMVPATQDQIRTMAYGGAVEPKKFERGGKPEYDQNLDAAFLYRSGLMEQLKELNTAVEEGLIGQTTADQDRQQIMAELLRSLNPDNFDRRDFIKNQLADEATSYKRKNIDRTLFKELSETRTRELLDDLQQFDSSQVDEYKGIFDESGIPNEQLPQAGQALTDKDLIDLATRPQLAEGGPITEERLNQLRLR